jgi:predicted  nucleic acid-binding Zn-ribbon protein
MSQQIIDIGSGAGAGDGDDLRVAFDKVNQNFANIYNGNVTVAANTLVYSVAGKQGNVELAWFDVTGVASNVDVSQLRLAMAANSAADRAYTDNAVSSLGPLPNVTVTGGNLTGVVISNAQITAGNITVTNTATVNGALVVDGPASVTENLVVGQTLTVATLRFADNSSMTTVVNLAPINSAVAGANARVAAANVEIDKLRANVEAANASIVSTQSSITTLSSNAATQAVAIGAVASNVSVLQANAVSVWSNAVSQAVAISSLRANIEAANAAIAAGGATIAQVTAANVEIANLRANITAANASINSLRIQSDANAAAQHNSIAGLRANITAANSAIITANAELKTYTDSAISSLSSSLTANAAVQGLAISRLNANVAAANAAISAANITAANIQISELRANITAANATIEAIAVAWIANAATQAVQINVLTANAGAQTTALGILTNNASAQSSAISSLQANIAAANAAILAITVPDLSGNIQVGNIQGYHGNFSVVSGTVLTAAQPNITTIGTLGNLVVTSNITAGRLTATVIAGTLTNGVQAGITGVGTLNTLQVSGNIFASVNVWALTGSFTNVYGTLRANGVNGGGHQPFITGVGTLDALAVTGNIDSGNINTLNANIATNRLVANTVVGTLNTPVQTNITRIGTLVNLAVTGNTTSGNVVTSGTVSAAHLAGTLDTAAQPNITTVGNLTSLSVGGNLTLSGNLFTPLTSVIVVGSLLSDYTFANIINAANIIGTLSTAAQPNITSVGTLVSVTSTGNVVAANMIANAQVTAVTVRSNLIGTTATLTGNITSGNITTGTVQASGNIYANEIDASSGVSAPLMRASIGNFTESIFGTLKTNAQPFVTSIGTLSGLSVDGPVSITGSQFVAQDFYVTGNLFVNGNTTTVSAGNVTTSDKDLTLANGAVNSTAARGSGILIGVGGAYGNLTIYDGVWTTPNAFAIAGNVSAGNVSGTKGSFTVVGGTLETAAQPNITTVGVLGSVTTTGAITGANIDVVGGTVRDLNATNANLTTIRGTHVFASGNVMAEVGEFTGLAGSLRTALQPNITQIGTLSNLTVTGNVTTGNVSGTTGAFTNLSGTLQTVSQPNITTVGNLGNLRVTGVATVGGLVIESGGAGSAFSVENITATANLTTSNLTVTGIANLVSFTGTILNNAQPYITSVGTLTSLDVTGNVGAGNVNATTGHFANVTATTLVRGENVSANANVTAVNGVFTNVIGALQTASQTNITSVGTLISLDVTGNATTGNVSGATGTFTNIRGAVLDASQTNITTIGTLSGLTVSGTTALANVSANGVTVKDLNTTHANIGADAQIAGNVSAGNISASKGTFGQVQATLLTSVQPFITEIGQLGNLDVAGTITAPLIGTTTGLLRGILVNSFQPNILELGTLTSLAVSNQTSVSNLYAISGVIRDFNATTANIASQANIAGNVTAANVSTFKGTFTQIDGTLLTNAQPFITSIGTLPSLVVTGNIGADNLNANTSNITGNSVTQNDLVTGTTDTNNLTVRGTGAFLSNVEVKSNLNVTSFLTVSGANLNAFSANFQSSSASITNTLYADTVRINNSTLASSATTGALVVAGGIGVQNLYSANNIISQSNIAAAGNLIVNDNAYFGNIVYLYDLGGPGTGNVTGIYSNVANIALFPSSVTNLDIGGEATLVNVGAISGAGITKIRNDLLVEGGFILPGGLGNIGLGNVDINNDLTVANNVSVANAITSATLTTGSSTVANNIVVGNLTASANATSLNTGALRVRGGASIVNNLFVGNPNSSNSTVFINSITQAANTTSGALQVAGGVGIGANLYVGGNVTIGGNINFTSFTSTAIDGTPIGGSIPSSGVFTTLGYGSANVRPPSRPAISFDFANSRKLDPILNYNRSGVATYYDFRGKLVSASPHVPRFTYDPATLRTRGILIEESRTNLYRESNGFSNATVYTTLNASVSTVAHATTSPDGAYNAYKIIEDSSTGFHGTYQQGGYLPSLTSGATYTASAFAKRGERDQVALVFFGEGTPTVFDLTNGVVDSEGPGYRSSIQTLANGWYRIQSTVNKNNTSGNVAVALATGGSIYYAGGGTSGAYVYGLQIEEGEFATSYIPTTTIANTRGADNLTITNTETVRRYNTRENSVLVDATLDHRPTTLSLNNERSTFISFNDGTAINRVSVLAETKSASSFRAANLVIVTAGTVESNATIIGGNLIAVDDNNRVAAYFQSGTLATAANGIGTTTGVAGNVSVAINTINIGYGPGSNYINGTIAKIQVWPALVTGSQLSTLTK